MSTFETITERFLSKAMADQMRRELIGAGVEIFEPAQLIASASGAKSIDIIDDPHAYVRSVCARHKISANKLAAKVGISASTLTRPLNSATNGYKHTIAARTLKKIKDWDEAHD